VPIVLQRVTLVLVILIPQWREKDLTDEADITLGTQRGPSPLGRSLTAFGMTNI
jgi:hypothetical protein